MLIRFLWFLCCAVSSFAYAADGLIDVRSEHDVEVTTERLKKILEEKGMTLFNDINHSAGAEKAGLTLTPTRVVIFGNPKVGTPLMMCARTVAIDLPQKMLVWRNEKGETVISYNDPTYLMKRHDIKGCDEIITKVSGALSGIANQAAGK